MSYRVRIEFEVDSADRMREVIDEFQSANPQVISEAEISSIPARTSAQSKCDVSTLLASLNAQQHSAISFIARHDDGVTENELRKHLGLAENAIAGVMSGLSRTARRTGFELSQLVQRRRGWTPRGAVQFFLVTPGVRKALVEGNMTSTGDLSSSCDIQDPPSDVAPSVTDIRGVMKDKAMRRREIARELHVSPATLDPLLTKENGFEKRGKGWFVSTSAKATD